MHTIFRRTLHRASPFVVKSSLLVLFCTSCVFYVNYVDTRVYEQRELSNLTVVDNNAKDRSTPKITRVNQTFNKKLRIIEETVNRLLDNEDFYRRYKRFQLETTANLSLCAEYRKDAEREQFYISQIWKNELSIEPESITYVTQLTLNRLYLIDKIQEQWSGPLSVSLYLDIDEVLSFKEKLSYYPSVIERDNIDLHIVLATGVSTTFIHLLCWLHGGFKHNFPIYNLYWELISNWNQF